LLNVVTEPEGTAGAVLIRAVEPLEGLAAMQANRPPTLRRARDLTSGPGKLTQALGIDGGFHRADLTRPPLYFAEDGALPPEVAVSSRIGISRGIERMYRFYVPRHPYVSPGLPSDLRVARRTKRDQRRGYAQSRPPFSSSRAEHTGEEGFLRAHRLRMLGRSFTTDPSTGSG